MVYRMFSANFDGSPWMVAFLGGWLAYFLDLLPSLISLLYILLAISKFHRTSYSPFLSNSKGNPMLYSPRQTRSKTMKLDGIGCVDEAKAL